MGVLFQNMIRPFSFVVASLGAFTFTSLAAEGEIAPAADAVLVRAGEFFQQAKSASTAMTVTISQGLAGEKVAVDAVRSTLAMQRPNQFAFHLTESPEGKMSHVCDGKTVWTFVEPLKQFTVEDAPATLEALLMSQSQGLLPLMQAGPTADLFRADPRKAMLDGVQVLRLVGEEKLGDVVCEHLHGEQVDMDWELWFEKGDKPVLRKVSYSPLKGIIASAPEGERAKLAGATYQIVVELADWKVGDALAAGTFSYEPPKGAKKVARFHSVDGDGGETAAEKLKGTVAADFSAPLLGGGKMQLASHKDKEVVILDFWATWCGPCVQGLPIVSEVAAMYKAKGVVFYAVNQGEEEADVKKFLAAKKLEIAVAMDTEGAVGKLFKVQGIPQTVIIGKDGKVAAVHIGFSGNLKEMLVKQLDAALAQ